MLKFGEENIEKKLNVELLKKAPLNATKFFLFFIKEFYLKDDMTILKNTKHGKIIHLYNGHKYIKTKYDSQIRKVFLNKIVEELQNYVDKNQKELGDLNMTIHKLLYNYCHNIELDYIDTEILKILYEKTKNNK